MASEAYRHLTGDKLALGGTPTLTRHYINELQEFIGGNPFISESEIFDVDAKDPLDISDVLGGKQHDDPLGMSNDDINQLENIFEELSMIHGGDGVKITDDCVPDCLFLTDDEIDPPEKLKENDIDMVESTSIFGDNGEFL